MELNFQLVNGRQVLLFAHACAKIYNIRYWKKNGSRILVLDRSESVFALLKLFSGYGSFLDVYSFLWTGYLINLTIHFEIEIVKRKYLR